MRLFFTCLAAFICFQIFAQKPDSVHVAGPDSLSPPSFFPIDRDSLFKKPPFAAEDTLGLKLNNDSIVSDTLIQKEKKKWIVQRVFSKNYPNPRMAALLSFVLPGAGQAYNKKWWKIPIVWGALAGIGYFTFDTQKTYHKLRDNYKILVDDDPNTNPTESPYNTFDATRTKSYRDTFRGYTEKWYLALGVTYLLAVTDAFVDAHLARFDISDDLSLRLKPSMETTGGFPVLGLGVALNLRNAPSKTLHPSITPLYSRP
ncbi:MAG: hypothetical protein H7246_00135 [Phycisphaerae bacterium]|nr:hypothetical protein [Saprospiraceae bacterium]